MLIGCFLVIVGVWLRAAIKVNFLYVVIGQVLAAAGNSFIIFSIAASSERWFSPQERTISSSWSIFGGTLGALLSTVGGSAFISDIESKQDLLSA